MHNSNGLAKCPVDHHHTISMALTTTGMNQTMRPTQLAAPTLVTAPHRLTRRPSAMRVQAASNADMTMTEPMIYAKAFASVVARRATELMLNCASEISIAIAEQPQRLKEFQEEVQAVAERERRSSNQPGLLTTASSSNSSSSSSSTTASAGSKSRAPADLESVVDELRADIAASRALLQQMRLGQQPDSTNSR